MLVFALIRRGVGLGLDMGDGAAPLRKLTPVESEASLLESIILKQVGNLAL